MSVRRELVEDSMTKFREGGLSVVRAGGKAGLTSVVTGRVPMSVVGGFLGAGKTTLLNRILAGRHGVRYMVLVNDFGELNMELPVSRVGRRLR